MAGNPLDDAFAEAARQREQEQAWETRNRAAKVGSARDWLDGYQPILRDLQRYVTHPPEDVLLVWPAHAQVPTALQHDGAVIAGRTPQDYRYGRCSAWRFRYHRYEGQDKSVFIAADRSALFAAEWGFHEGVKRKPRGWKRICLELHRLGAWAEPVTGTHRADVVDSDAGCTCFADGGKLSALWDGRFRGLPAPETLARIIAGLERTR